MYLQPYFDAARRHGGGFGSLLWASPDTQQLRFDAFARLVAFTGASVLDVGCGRADLLDFLIATGQAPAEYIGIEGVPALAEAAEGRGIRIARADFIAEPQCLFTGSDIIAISGALNTCEDEAFYGTIKRAFDATARHVVFNFLSSTYLAAARHLYWRKTEEVQRFCRNILSTTPVQLADYLEGDTTFLLTKQHD